MLHQLTTRIFFFFKHLQASKTEHSVSVFLVVEKWPLFKQGVLKAPLYYILFTKRAFRKFKCRSWLVRLVEGRTRKRNQCLPITQYPPRENADSRATD